MLLIQTFFNLFQVQNPTVGRQKKLNDDLMPALKLSKTNIDAQKITIKEETVNPCQTTGVFDNFWALLFNKQDI